MHAAQILEMVASNTSYMASLIAEYSYAVLSASLSCGCIINMVEGAP